jgi:protein phosphatase 1 regulatory subunit 16A
MDPSESEDSDVDSLTPSLEAAMPPEQRLSTQERLRLARRRRSEQLKKWGQREREWQIHIAAQNRPPERNERVTFVPNVMLLEAAARNDLAEGKPHCVFTIFSTFFLFSCLVKTSIFVKTVEIFREILGSQIKC